MAEKEADGKGSEIKHELDRFKDVQENSLPQITKLIDSYEKSNEKLTAAGQRLAAELKKLGDKSDNQWAKSLSQLAEHLSELEAIRATELEKPIQDSFLTPANQSANTDKENFKSNRKKIKSALKKLDARVEKIEKSGKKDEKSMQELRDLETKRNDMLMYVRQYESMRYCKWMQTYCVVLSAQLAYHKGALAKLSGSQATFAAAVNTQPPPLPNDTWSAYIEERDKNSARGGSPRTGAPAVSLAPTSSSTTAAGSSPSSAPAVTSAELVKNTAVASAPRPKASSPWKLFPTDDGEDFYYFNEATGESIWELPASEVEA